MVAPAAVVREVLGCVPQLLGDTHEELESLVAAAKQLIASDRTLMLPAIGALGEVALPDSLKPELARLALGALPLADEPDLPTLVRCVLGAVVSTKAGRTLRGLRAHLGTVSSGTLALLLQVVGNTLRVNGGVARALLAQCASAPNLTHWDTLLLLLLLPMPRHTSAATHALARALHRGALAAAELAACAADPALPPPVLAKLPALVAALLADTSPETPYHGARLAVSLIVGGQRESSSSSGSGSGSGGGSGSGSGSSRGSSRGSGSGSSFDASGPPPADSTAIQQQTLSELLTALFSSPAAASAAANALGELAVRAAPSLGGAAWSMLQEALSHAPRLPYALLPPFFACLAAAAAVQPSLRPPLLLFVQKHAFNAAGGQRGDGGGQQHLRHARGGRGDEASRHSDAG